MSRQKPVSELGVIEESGVPTYRVHVQYRDADGKNQNIYGPWRLDRWQAEADLQSIREAGSVPFFENDRPGALKAMAAEARRIQMRRQAQHNAIMAMAKDSDEESDGYRHSSNLSPAKPYGTFAHLVPHLHAILACCRNLLKPAETYGTFAHL